MSQDLAAYLQSLEEQLLEPAIRANPEAVSALLADDFREFGSSGCAYTKDEMIAALAVEEPARITLGDFECRMLTREIALLTYRSQTATKSALRSSLWVVRDHRWQMLFHQGTTIPA